MEGEERMTRKSFGEKKRNELQEKEIKYKNWNQVDDYCK